MTEIFGTIVLTKHPKESVISNHQFTRDDRIKLVTLKSQGLSNRQIAQILGFHKSSMGRELCRNSVRGRYCSTATGRLAINRR
ncbi:MAG: helix-turn-helix domain-containing protein, partial [Candidatus Hydrogenedentales bacterium]